ncbi:MAG: bifunctional 5,10-methylenetetrahydrofolate dehydrogenase/5,10-methenyltetrahydrofolate cyclohydrolase [Bacteroidota bacterium]
MPVILDGRALAQVIRQELAQAAQGITPAPHLAIVLIGDHPASHTYVRQKIRACHEVGFRTTCIEKAQITEAALLALVEDLNRAADIDGLIIQLPLPPHINLPRVIQQIHPAKDVDGLHALNYGCMARNLPAHVPATPLGILTLLARYQIETLGKHCVVVGRGAIVGAPLSILLSRNAYPGNATVTLCHRHTHDLARFTQQADILVAAVGQPRLITASMVKRGALVIDVGITRVQDDTARAGYRLQGDVDFEEVAPHCSHITPVPGGVGPMTVVALLSNTLRAAQQNRCPTADSHTKSAQSHHI